MLHFRTTRRLAAGVAVAASVAVAATGASGATPRASSSTSQAYASAAKFVYGSKYAQYLGKKANPHMSTVVVGMWNDDGGVFANPGIQDAAQAAAAFANNHLGGIAGHPIKLVICAVVVEADGQKCGQSFANNKSMAFAIQGFGAIGAASYYQAIDAKKPTLDIFPVGPDLTAKNAFLLSAGPFTVISRLWYAHEHGVKSLAEITLDEPVVHSTYDPLVSRAKKIGLTYQPVYYPPTSTDITPNIQAANLSNIGAIETTPAVADGCVSSEQAFAAAGLGSKPVYALNTCLVPAVKTALGDYPKWTYFLYTDNPLGSYAPSSDIASYVDAMREYDPHAAADIPANVASSAFAAVITADHMLSAPGQKLTPSAISAAFRAYKGPMFIGPPNISFGNKPFPNVGSYSVLPTKYLGHGKWTTEPWVQIPESVAGTLLGS